MAHDSATEAVLPISDSAMEAIFHKHVGPAWAFTAPQREYAAALVRAALAAVAPVAAQPAQAACKWEDDTIQFPRLLAEIVATQDHLDLEALADSMDLRVRDVNELFDRAQASWERAKGALL